MLYDFGRLKISSRKTRSAYNWSTESEIDFLKRLGTHRQGQPDQVGDVPKRERLQLLYNYRSSMRNRTNWGDVDSVEVAKALHKMIRELEASS